jgi:CyaY protein
MNESEFLRAATAILDRIEEAIDASGADVDFERKGEGVLALEFANGTQIIVNLQAPMRQIWIASKAGGFHFAPQGASWIDTRSGEELFAVLSSHASAQSGSGIVLTN